jgi:hypothetical protein
LRGPDLVAPHSGSSRVDADPGGGPAATISGAETQRQIARTITRFRSIPDVPRLRATAVPRDPGRIAIVVVPLLAFAAALAVPFVTSPPPPQASSVTADVGYADFSYAANGVSAPTGVKPETSKLWFSHGSWWAVMFRPARDAYVVNKLEPERQEWLDTGVVVDDRNQARADVLWDGHHVYIVSGGTDAKSPKQGAIFTRLSFGEDDGRWSVDAGFPIRLTETGAETFAIDKDGEGTLWVAYTRDRSVYVTHSAATEHDWARPYVVPLPEATNLTVDDIAVPISYDGHIGIMWSDQTDGAVYFAAHATGAADDAWSLSTALQGPALADDHMNLKALRDDPAGLVFAAVKTSRNDLPSPDPDDPLIVLLVLRRDGSWEQHVVGSVRDNSTRPLLEIDTDHRQVYVFTSAPCCSGGSILYKTARLDELDFPVGDGSPFIRRGRSAALNNPTSTKQNVDAMTGILVLASDDKINYYMHNSLALGGPIVPKPTAAGSPAPGSSPGRGADGAGMNLIDDGFELGHPAAGAAFATGQHSVGEVEPGIARSDRYAAHLAAGGLPDAFSVLRYRLDAPRSELSVSLDYKVLAEGDPDGNVPVLRLLDSGGDRLITVYRQNGRDGRVWIRVGDNRIASQARIDLATWTVVQVIIRSETTGRVAEVRVEGRLVGEATLPATAGAQVLELGNSSTNQPFDLVIDNVRVGG